MTTPLSLLAAHWIGDFVCQSDAMAQGKAKHWNVLAFHVTVYTIIVSAVMTAPVFLRPESPPWFWVFAQWYGLTWVSHFVTDAVTSRITATWWFFQMEPGIWTQADYTVPKHGRTLVNPWTPIEGKRHWFFVLIGLDQLIHYATLAGTLAWLT